MTGPQAMAPADRETAGAIADAHHAATAAPRRPGAAHDRCLHCPAVIVPDADSWRHLPGTLPADFLREWLAAVDEENAALLGRYGLPTGLPCLLCATHLRDHGPLIRRFGAMDALVDQALPGQRPSTPADRIRAYLTDYHQADHR